MSSARRLAAPLLAAAVAAAALAGPASAAPTPRLRDVPNPPRCAKVVKERSASKRRRCPVGSSRMTDPGFAFVGSAQMQGAIIDNPQRFYWNSWLIQSQKVQFTTFNGAFQSVYEVDYVYWYASGGTWRFWYRRSCTSAGCTNVRS